MFLVSKRGHPSLSLNNPIRGRKATKTASVRHNILAAGLDCKKGTNEVRLLKRALSEQEKWTWETTLSVFGLEEGVE